MTIDLTEEERLALLEAIGDSLSMTSFAYTTGIVAESRTEYMACLRTIRAKLAGPAIIAPLVSGDENPK
jgi:hypothetical protein